MEPNILLNLIITNWQICQIWKKSIKILNKNLISFSKLMTCIFYNILVVFIYVHIFHDQSPFNKINTLCKLEIMYPLSNYTNKIKSND